MASRYADWAAGYQNEHHKECGLVRGCSAASHVVDVASDLTRVRLFDVPLEVHSPSPALSSNAMAIHLFTETPMWARGEVEDPAHGLPINAHCISNLGWHMLLRE